MQTIFLRILPARIGWFKFILEGYDGLAVLTTLDRKQGLVSVTFHHSCTKDLFSLLDSLSRELAPFSGEEKQAGSRNECLR